MSTPEGATVLTAATGPLAALVRQTAAAYPEAVAVDAPDRVLRYGELLARAEELAAHLRASGASTVAVTGERGAALVVAVLAVVLAPARLLTVDPELPAARRVAMLRAGRAELLLVAPGADPAGLDGVPVLAVGPDGRFAAGNVTGALHADPVVGGGAAPGAVGGGGQRPADPGYLFFTSGTTGRPKAVLGRQSAVAHFVRWQRDRFGVGPGDRFAQLTAISFDVILRDMFTPLAAGAAICVPPAAVAGRPDQVPGWLRAAGITVVHAVPSLAARWTRGDAPGADAPLRLTFFAGEPLADAAVRRWRQCFPRTRVVNLYGPTETTLAKFYQEIDVPHPGIQPVGRPLPDTQLRLVDGEVWIRTPHRAQGYLDDPQEQRRRFVTLPDDDPAAGPWYRTGDVGELDASGALHLRGRTDFQVKVNGNRVEPEGVAAVLRGHPAVDDAVVVARTRPDGGVYLAAFHTGRHDDGIRDWLGERLPASHVPSVFRLLTELPLTVNGKVDRAALPDPLAASTGAVAAAEDAVEGAVRAAFAGVLGAGADHPDADFFDRGGTSLDAAELCGRLLEGTGRRFDMSELYRLRTVRAVSAVARDRARHAEDAIPRVGQPAVTGLSAQQRRYRNVYLPRINRSWSNMPAQFVLPDGTTADAVEAALEVLVQRHDSLRASFEELPGGDLRQHFVDRLGVSVATVDLREHADAAQRAELERLRVAEANTPIDITAAPLFRAQLIRHQGDRATLLWTVHHMVSDGYSQQILRTELLALLGGTPADALPALPISYRDYLSWQQSLPADAQDASPAYWREVFARPYQRPLLPERRPSARGLAYQFPIPPQLHAQVAAHCRVHGVTAFSVYLAAYFLMAHRLFDRDDLVIGTPAAGRTRRETTGLIGNFISLVGIRHHTGEALGFTQLVAAMQERTVAAMEHQDYQYDQIMVDIGAERDDDRFPLTTVFISLVDVPADQAAALHSPAHRDLGCEVKFDLMGYLRRSGETIALDLNTRDGLLDPDRLVQLGEVFLAELRAGLGTAVTP